ncbi:MAG: preprotein translocase subunit SecE [Candidatus Dojkabacteria bacterium]
MKKLLNALNKFGGAISALPGVLRRYAKKSVSFFRNAFKELETVEWLTPRQTLKFGVYVLIFISISTAFIAAVDLAFFELLALFTG